MQTLLNISYKSKAHHIHSYGPISSLVNTTQGPTSTQVENSKYTPIPSLSLCVQGFRLSTRIEPNLPFLQTHTNGVEKPSPNWSFSREPLFVQPLCSPEPQPEFESPDLISGSRYYSEAIPIAFQVRKLIPFAAVRKRRRIAPQSRLRRFRLPLWPPFSPLLLTGRYSLSLPLFIYNIYIYGYQIEQWILQL